MENKFVKDLLHSNGVIGNDIISSSIFLKNIGSKEGALFWFIIAYSLYFNNSPDYLTIINIYHTYGKKALSLKITPYIYHPSHNSLEYINGMSTLNQKGREWLYEKIEKRLSRL